VQGFRGGLVVKAHRLLYHSTLGLRVIQKKIVFLTGNPFPEFHSVKVESLLLLLDYSQA